MMHCTIGPVIGEVTDTTARILLECDSSGRVDLQLKSQDGKHIHMENQVMVKGRPKLFKFQHLTPGTHYTVTAETVKLVSSKFRTLPEGGFLLRNFKKSGKGPRFGFISGNKIYASLERDETRKSICLWRDLAKKIKKFDYLFHLGDNVYADSDLYCMKNGFKTYTGTPEESKWRAAIEHINSEGEFYEHKWTDRKDEVREIFRAVYRKTWGSIATRTVLANVPNIMVYAEQDIAHNFAIRKRVKGSLEEFIAMQAYYIVGEYQTQLHKDFFEVSANDMGYHFHSFGDIGFYLQDIVGCKTFHQDGTKKPMLGERQWTDFRHALGTGGTFEKAKILFALMPRPMFFHTEQKTTLQTGLDDGFRNMWMNAPHVPEATELLDAIVTWKQSAEGREVLLVGGNVMQGGWTNIELDGENGLPTCTLKQLTTGAMAAEPMRAQDDLPQSVSRAMASKHGGNYSFKHFGWTKRRNYGVVQMNKDALGNPSFVGHLIESSDYLVSRKDLFDAKFDPGANLHCQCADVTGADCTIL
eukprot:GEMP01028987.1.p1 GENE.GEMP01028987.1~~GEMP01028987.1.p1  ORF type:complete len:528 (+),score=95.61 GEMP01028987.1:97-1680(+)